METIADLSNSLEPEFSQQETMNGHKTPLHLRKSDEHRQEELKTVLELKNDLVLQRVEREKKKETTLMLVSRAQEVEELRLKERRDKIISALNWQSAKTEELSKETEDRLDKLISDLQENLQGKTSSSSTDYTVIRATLQTQVQAIQNYGDILRTPFETLLTFGDATFKEYLQSDSLLENLIPRPDIKHLHTADIQLSSQSNCWITGTCVLRNGDVVAVDRQNRLLIWFKSENDYHMPLHFDLYNRPYGLALSGEGSVAVTFPWAWKVEFFDLGSGVIQQGKKNISVGRSCYGIATSKNTLIVSCCEHFYSSQNMFQVYENEVLTRVIKSDRLGKSFHIANGYFDYCPFRERILFFNGEKYTEMSFSGDMNEISYSPWCSGSAIATIGIYRLLAVSTTPSTERRICLAKQSPEFEMKLLDGPFKVVNAVLSVSLDPVSRILVISEENSRSVRDCAPNYLHFFKF